MTWKLDVCCDMMQEGLDCKQVHVDDDRMVWLPLENGSCTMDYCPWCGRKIRFKRCEEEEE